MNEHKRTSGNDCWPPSDDPAPHPKPPSSGDDTCKRLPSPEEPKLPPLEPCKPPDDCKCPKGPTSDPNCLETMITAKAADIAAAEKAKAFKTELEALLTKAKTASQDYTREKYEKLAKQWDEQDEDIARLIHKLVCAVKCWRCIIECFVCPYLNRMRDAEIRLYGDPNVYPDGALYSDVRNLYDLLYWRQRDRDIKQRRFNRIKDLLTAWEKPAQTIEKTLTDNAKLIGDAEAKIGSDAARAVFDVFLQLVPRHLAIAPPEGSKWKTRIDKEYTEFCKCDEGRPDDCCGPDVGERRLRDRVIGYFPYLVDPNDYFTVICCLVKHRYGPAQEAFGLAEAAVQTTETEIKNQKAIVENGLKSFDKDARGAIPADFDCCDFKKKDDDDDDDDDDCSRRSSRAR